MKKILLAGTALLTLISGSAMAADMRPARAPVYTKAPMMAPTYNWTGCYIGGNVGGLWATKDWSDSTTGVAHSTQDISSWLGGGQVGCNYQVSTWVFGVQGDYDWTNASASARDGAFVGLTDQSTIKALASVTGRVGYAWDRFLGYVKGGGAWENDNYLITTTATGATSATASETRTGWTIGVGGEYAFAEWLTGFAEYDYYDFGTKTNTFVTTVPSTVLIDVRERKSVAKVGLNIKLGGWGGPVTSRY
jgi:outer membrane immunogenic protein